MEEVANRLTSALLKVASNKGAPGPDGQTIEALREQWPVVVPRLQADLLEGRYRPGEIRRAYIPKAGGGQRGLGIPDVVDRVVCEAVRQVLEPLYEPTFHPSSHGFRPGRSCHTAIAEAKQHLEDGYGWVVDLDLEKFFDLVCHQRLIAKLAQRVSDRRLLVLIGRMLKAKVVLPDGVVIASEQGVPQGSPLSPLLSNIVLDELDQELARRGHRFVRYADDGNVYVRSERAGLRVMASLTEFIERRLRLKVNEAKSAVARPEDRHFLGFRLRVDPQTGTVEVLLSERTKRNAMERVRQLTPRTWGSTLRVPGPDQRVAAGMARVLRDRLGSGDADHARARRPHQASAARDPAAPLETQADDRPQPHHSRRPPAASVAAVYTGHKSLWALSHIPQSITVCNRGSSPTAGSWRWSIAPPRTRGDRRPRPAATGAMGIDRGRKAAGGGVHNPPSRGAVCDQRKHGSVGAGAGNRPGYPTPERTGGGAPAAGPPSLSPELVDEVVDRAVAAVVCGRCGGVASGSATR